MKEYVQQINNLINPTFQQIRQIADKSLAHLTQSERDTLWGRLNHGVDLLDSHELMCQYLWSFGKMHEAKIQRALNSIPEPNDVFNNDFSIIDWGCGQGLATVCFFDYLNQNHISNNIKKVILIEPSNIALGRAKLHVNAYLKDENKIQTVNKFLDDVTPNDLQADTPITIHFFSNILDIPQIDLKHLAQLVGENVVGEHYFFCVGPLNAGNNRIEAFYDYFNSPLVLKDEAQSENRLKVIAEEVHNKDFQRNYTLRLKVFKFERNKIYYIPIEYYPSVQFHAGYQLDCVKDTFKKLPNDEQVSNLYHSISDFELSAPFDIGASIYDDVHPILAVLNNIVTRGLPTKASPFIEECFEKFENIKKKDDLGSIKFENNTIAQDELFLALHLIDSRFEITNQNYNSKVLDSDLEQTYITQNAHNILRQLLQPQRSLTSITNNNEHYAQRVDFACEFPYSGNNNVKGCVIELDGEQYHQDTAHDQQRDNALQNSKWNIIRIRDKEINTPNYSQLFDNEYYGNVRKSYLHQFDESWITTLQIVLSPIAIARVQKTILEALMTSKLNIEQKEWKILVHERDVPCAAIAFEDLKMMFNHLTALSKEYSKMKFPEIKLEIISTQEFADSSLHLDIKPAIQATKQQKNNQYDMVIDISMLRRANIENLSFSEFQCKNNCYFNIRSAHYTRSVRPIYTSDTIEYLPLVTKDNQGNYKDITETKEHLQYFVRLLFRKEDFRPGQLPILDRALQNKSVIGLLPTGGGKSLTYQLAAMLQAGVTIVVDPLRSLMEDQYDGLINAGIDTCTFINSTIDARKKERREKQMESSQMQFVFLSPERLCIYKFREKLKTMRDLHVYFAYGVIDEVHCVSEWGHDFRFSYLHLGRNLCQYVLPKDKEKRLTLFGLTATASFDVLADVERELSGNGAFPLDADSIVRYENTNRLELQYKIERVDVKFSEDPYFDKNKQLQNCPVAVKMDKWGIYESKKEFLTTYLKSISKPIREIQTKDAILQIEKSFKDRQGIEQSVAVNLEVEMPDNFYREQETYKQSGIIFCPHKDKTGIAVHPNASSLSAYIPRIGTFMGSSNDNNDNEEKDDSTDKISFENLKLFRNNQLPLMVATKAFGMGIDKPNVRFTVNMNYSSSLEGFVQEAGRAGRDGKTALSIILVADYHLVRINKNYPENKFPLGIIKDKWFYQKDFDVLSQQYNLQIDKQYIDFCTPEHDMVKLRCEKCARFAWNSCETSCRFEQCKARKSECNNSCQYADTCSLKNVPSTLKGWGYQKDLERDLQNNNITFKKENIEYQNADYDTMIFFYNNSFKGVLYEKNVMYQLLNKSEMAVVETNDTDIKIDTIKTVHGFISSLLEKQVGERMVFMVSYQKDSQADIAKAIYRMCCIDLIDDFTQDYGHKCFKIVTERKADGEYYQGLKTFLLRYYSEDKATQEIQKVPDYEGENEVHKCLGYLTEFIYDKIAVKRKRAIDDMRTFCIQGLDDTKDWKEVNEDLKDFIYYYFNSKYAKEDYVADNGEAFSITEDTDRGKKSSHDLVFKYMRVIDDDLVGAGTPKDNVKHLQGAVRLIRRSLTDMNPALDLLNAFCLLYLGTNNNETLEDELKRSYQEGLLGFMERIDNHIDFWRFFDKYNHEIAEKARDYSQQKFESLKNEINLQIHANIISKLTNKYTEK
ncbi:hypothetical protein AGMMS49965_12490 [Bacteroidia bacterium]|nr:hypothetical protein AGMMS49965_12490 [Bacteroidia bacterium]